MNTFSQPGPLSDGSGEDGVKRKTQSGSLEKPVKILFADRFLYSFLFRTHLRSLATASDWAGVPQQSKAMVCPSQNDTAP